MKIIYASLLVFLLVSCNKSNGDGAIQGGEGGQPPGTNVTEQSSQLAQDLAGKLWCERGTIFTDEQGQKSTIYLKMEGNGTLTGVEVLVNNASQEKEFFKGAWSAGTSSVTLSANGETVTYDASYDKTTQLFKYTDEEGLESTFEYCGDVQ